MEYNKELSDEQVGAIGRGIELGRILQTIELEQLDVKYIPSGNIVDTGTLGPCTGVIIHNSQKKEAYAGHFVDSELDGLEDMVKSAISKFHNLNQLDVYVAGNSVNPVLFDDDYVKYALQDRKFIPDLLKKYGFLDSKVHIRWSPLITSDLVSCDAHLWLDVDSAENELEVTENSYHKHHFHRTVYKDDIKNAPNPF